MLKALLPICKRAIITSPKIDRALAPEKLSAVAENFITDITIIPDVNEAVKYAIKTALPDDVVCIAGSLYLVGDAKKALKIIKY